MIRHANIDDIEQCLDVCAKASSLSGNYGEFNRSIARQSLRVRILNPYSLVLTNENRDGLLIGIATPSIHTTQIKVANEFLYADSEGAAFIKSYLRWANAWGNTEINFCTSFGGEKGARAEKLLQRLGFSEIGKQFRVI